MAVAHFTFWVTFWFCRRYDESVLLKAISTAEHPQV